MDLYRTAKSSTGIPGAIAPADGNLASGVAADFSPGSQYSANFVAASTVFPPYDAISAWGTVPIARPPHQDAFASVVTPIGTPRIAPATKAA